MSKASKLPSNGSSNPAIVSGTAFLQNVESLVSKAWSWHESMGGLDFIVFLRHLSMEQLAELEPKLLEWVDDLRRKIEFRRKEVGEGIEDCICGWV